MSILLSRGARPGVMLSAVAFYAWRRGAQLLDSTHLEARIAKVARPMKPIIVGAGLSLLAVAAAGMSNQLFTAPPQTLSVAGWVFLLFGALNSFSHIGLVVNTM